MCVCVCVCVCVRVCVLQGDWHASCPACATRLVLPPGLPAVRCPACSAVVPRADPRARAGPAPAPAARPPPDPEARARAAAALVEVTVGVRPGRRVCAPLR